MAYILEYAAFIKGFSRNAKLFLWSSALASLAQGMSSVVLNLYFLRVGRSEALLGSLVFYSAIAGVVCAIPAGRASDRFGRRTALLVSGVLCAGGTLVQVLYPVPGALVPATFVTGACWTVAMVTGGPLLVETSSPNERNHLFGLQAALTIGISFVGSNLGGLLPKLFGWLYGTGAEAAAALRGTLLVEVAVYLLALVPLLPMREERRANGRVSAAETFWPTFSNPGLVLRLLIPQALLGLGAGLVMPLQNVFMDRYLGATTAQIGLIFAASSALTGIGVLGAPLAARKWGRIRAATRSELASLPFLAVMGLVPNLGVYATASLIRSVLMNLANPLVSSFSLEVVDGRERATVNSLLNMVWSLGWALSGWAGGWIMQNVSYTLPYGFTFVLYTVSILLFYHFFQTYDLPAAKEAGGTASQA